ncbi:ABC transporter permease [Dyella psychrodurans]|uniref:Transport permease protein n=1 Tax=Dyella psychrodurans TaxID=1927960 RepID=A0A370X539_9GAMM|nr:ABC transporter permease [Dyella psychrodurans]RDS83397.1 ABC transporter permease [Dyella psychrodurans]
MQMAGSSLLGRVWIRRDVFWELTKRDIAGRYSGSFLGLLWSFLNPLLMLAVYTLAFRQFLGMRWPNMETGADFSLMIFSGMIVHTLMAECIARAPTSIVSNVNLVKRVVFPVALLPCVTVVSALFNAALSLTVLLLFVLMSHHSLSLSLLYLPCLFAPYAVLLCGISWFMASVGVFIRDITQLAGIITTMMMFLSPVFYPASSLHEPYRSWLLYNPLTLIIEQTRGLVLFGKAPDWHALGLYALVALAVLLAGYGWFRRTQDGFADVL